MNFPNTTIVTRANKLNATGWTQEAHEIIQKAREEGVCVQCGRRSRSKLPLGSAHRRIACSRVCSDAFYNLHYRSWGIAKRVTLARVRKHNNGQIRCEKCGGPPTPVRVKWEGYPGDYEKHPGYEFDHIVEIAAGGDALDPVNCQLLCLRCHRRKTARFLRRGTPTEAAPKRAVPLEAFSS